MGARRCLDPNDGGGNGDARDGARKKAKGSDSPAMGWAEDRGNR